MVKFGTDDSARMAEAGDWIVDCATGDQPVAHIRNGRPLDVYRPKAHRRPVSAT